MEFSFSDEPKKGGAPATKMYAQKKRGGEEKRASAGQEQPRTADGTGTSPSGRKHVREPATSASRIGLMFSGFLLAGMLLFTLSGYERISRSYADVNTINSEIDETELRIKALDVQIECAVTIRDAQDVAESYGMRYPTQSQYVKIGSTIPVSGSAPSGSAPGETTTPGETVTPDEGTGDTPADGTNPSGD